MRLDSLRGVYEGTGDYASVYLGALLRYPVPQV